MSYIIGIESEQWKKVPFANDYEVSSIGNVRKRINKTHPERKQFVQIKSFLDKDGYLRVQISSQHFPRKKIHIHRLVFVTFCNELIPGLVVCHLDGNKRNNTPSNLQQCTQKENISHKRLHGTWQAGEKHPMAKLTNEQAMQIREALQLADKSKSGRLKRNQAARIAESLQLSVQQVFSISRTRSSYAIYPGV